MNSIEKVQAAIDYLTDSTDEEVHAAVPFLPVGVVRGGLVLIESQVPDTPEELDQFLTDVGDFCHSLRGDPLEVTG